MRIIGQREFRNNSAAVMDAVEAGETLRVTRNGVEVAELRPLPRRRQVTTEELIERLRKLPVAERREIGVAGHVRVHRLDLLDRSVRPVRSAITAVTRRRSVIRGHAPWT